MKSKLILLVFFSLPLGKGWAFAQNLVPNPSFEDTVMCPSGSGMVSYAAHWQPYIETPDYFNSCASDSLFSVPNNFFGFQDDNQGQAYMGLATFLDENHREIICVELTSPLTINTNYYYSFKASRSRKNVASNKLGIWFQNQVYPNSTSIDFNKSQVYSNEIIVDSTEWTHIYGHFIPDSNYSAISIGNHFDNNNTDTLRVGNDGQPYYVAYYYIDDVCISTDSSKCEESFHTAIEKHSRSPTATYYDNMLRIKQGYYLIKQIMVVDMMGNEVFKTKNIKNEYDLSYLGLKPSIYNVFIETHKATTSIKIIIQ